MVASIRSVIGVHLPVGWDSPRRAVAEGLAIVMLLSSPLMSGLPAFVQAAEVPARATSRMEAAPIVADVVVYGATPAGVVAAVTAARAGADVILLEPTRRLGGMMSAGLSWADRGITSVIGGLAREVFDRIEAAEGSSWGRYAYQPHTAVAVFEAMVAEAGVRVFRLQQLSEAPDAVTKMDGRIVGVRTVAGQVFSADVFIDAGYEGDLMARTGVPFRIGREAQSDFGEPLAGVRWPVEVAPVPAGMNTGFPLAEPGPLGSADNRIQASNYRLCLTTTAANQIPFTRPSVYDPARYDFVAYYLNQRVVGGAKPSLSWVMHMDRLTAGKWDLNAHGEISFGLPGANWTYPSATYAQRTAMEREHRSYQQGFLYFLAHDPRVPGSMRTELGRYGLCADEFTATDNWPPQLYLREGRRMVGQTIVSQHDREMLISKPDAIGLASYPLDCHWVSRWIDARGWLKDEGCFGPQKSWRWSIPYRVLIPRRTGALNLLVPVAVSATHVAYSSLRVEPQYMIMGQAAGAAAAIAARLGLAVQDVPVDRLQADLVARGAVLDDPGDIASSPFYAEIAWAFYGGITAGCGPGHFCPTVALPRDQMASLLARARGLAAPGIDYFTDDEGNPHEADINRVAAAGITFGCGTGRYCPDRTVTRAEMASFMVRAFGLAPVTTDAFDDDGSIHEADINALAAASITSGCTPTAFCPTASMTREQALAFLYRAAHRGLVGADSVIAPLSSVAGMAPF